MTLQRQIDQLTTHRASEWLETLKSGGDRERAAFVEWLAESPRHVSELLSIIALEKELRALDLDGRFDLKSLLAEASAAPVAEFRPALPSTAAAKRRRTSVMRWATGLAAGIGAVVVGILYVRGDLFPGQIYTTAIGEQRSIELVDGSVVYLNAQSTLRVRFHERTRDLELTSGEALFNVAHDASRPFRVHTRDAVVQAVGTEFNVYARTASTTVAVIEGRVRIAAGSDALPVSGASDTAVSAGEEIEIESTGKIDRKVHADVARAVAWRQRRIIFDETALEDVVTEFNRYNQSPKLRLEDIAPGSRHYSGEFEANDPESLAALLSREQDLAIDRHPGEIVIRARR